MSNNWLRRAFALYAGGGESRVSIRSHLATRGFLFADNLLFSVANFVLTISLARLYAESDFAAMGVALAFALAVQAMQKSLYIVRVSLMPAHTARRRRENRRFPGQCMRESAWGPSPLPTFALC